MATLQQRADWLCEDTTPDLSGLSRGAREALSEHYRKAALLEHASVAAFSRFVMDLLSVGAPADLVEEAGRAMLDESAHARLCFGLACGFSGTALGPSPLSVQDSLDRRTLKEIVVTTVLEGCVGETIAAMEAVEALAHATDPAVRRALSRIAEDELRHAALAYRFVDWAISHFGPQVQEDVRGTFQAALTSQAPEPSGSRLAVPSHGLLSPAHRRELRARALRELVAPTLPALFAA